MKYKLIAMDMDGTALTDDKRLSPRTVAALEKAIEQGKHPVFATGRSVSLIRPYIEQICGMRYAITAAGAAVLDGEDYILKKTIDAETVKRIIAAASGSYVFTAYYQDRQSYGSAWCIEDLTDFGMKAFTPMYRKCMNIVPDAMEYFMEHPGDVEKFNLFFGNDYEAAGVYEKIKDLPISFSTRTKHSLEINAPGVSKAEGIRALCRHLELDISETIAVGDAQNDEPMVACAGLRVAMANGSDKLKAMADVIAPDNEHDGVASIIEQYILD